MAKHEFDPNEAAYGNIGRFMVAFSHVEALLDRAILVAYRLQSQDMAPALVAEVDFYKKLTILNAAIQGAQHSDRKPMSAEWKAKMKKLWKEIEGYNNFRRRVAHDYLAPETDGNVRMHKPIKDEMRGAGGTIIEDSEWKSKIDDCNRTAAELADALKEPTTYVLKVDTLPLSLVFSDVGGFVTPSAGTSPSSTSSYDGGSPKPA